MSPRSLPVLLLALAACAGEAPAGDGPRPRAGSPADEACPASRSDELCVALRASDSERARAVIGARVASEPREQVLADPAVRWFVRERAVALLAWNAAPADLGGFFAEFFPAHAASDFPLAGSVVTPVADGTDCAGRREALIVFVGVLRSVNRQEFERQAGALADFFPCLRVERVEYESFEPAAANAEEARALIARLDAELGPVPLHFLGYSQGVTNALHTLVDFPELAPRVRTLVALNSAAHGSETADALLAALPILDGPGIDCDDLPAFTRAACREVVRSLPIQDFLAAGVEALGADGLAPGSVRDFLRRRVAGLRSLGSEETATFWRERGDLLPRTTLYLSFRSYIGDPARNLPASNVWSYLILRAVDPSAKENDMQVRLVNQSLGGPLADLEVVLPAAEGNHWQWPLTSDDLSPLLQPPDMSERMPHEALLLACYQTLHEAGLVLP